MRTFQRSAARNGGKVLQFRTTCRPLSIKANATATEVKPKETITFDKKFDEGLHVAVASTEHGTKVKVRRQGGSKAVLHWAVNEWQEPSQAIWPSGTKAMGDGKAVQTPFLEDGTLEIDILTDLLPPTLCFVIKELEPERWISGSGQFTVPLKPPDASSIASKVITAESTYSNWSLFNRLCLCLEVLDGACLSGPDGMALVFTWLRLSSTRVLPWYKNSNYQSKDIAHVQKSVAQAMACKSRGEGCDDGTSQLFARMALAGLPRGGGNGDDIRMGILNIMRANGIKEGHRPGIEEHFLEEWHQKLHTNTTPDDIAICEAYLAFLHSNNHDDYWRVLYERGRLTRADLEGFGKPLKSWPMHLPHLIPAFQHFLWILKVTHSGADLDTAFTMASGSLDGELSWMISDILAHRNDWWVPGKIVLARQQLQRYWKAPGASRDLLLLDIALDDWFRTLIERVDLHALSHDDLIQLVSLNLSNSILTIPDNEELRQCLALWEMLKSDASGRKWSSDWSLMALAAVQRTELTLAATMDKLYSRVQPYAERFGEACMIDPPRIVNFGEEVVRGQPIFVLSSLLQRLEPIVRSAAGVAPWQIASQRAPFTGLIKSVKSLADLKGHEEEAGLPLILLSESLGGTEDIPSHIGGVLTRSMTDVLSHVAIRARSQHALLASCFDTKEWEALLKMDGKVATVSVGADGSIHLVEATAQEASLALPSTSGEGIGPMKKVNLGQVELPGPKSPWAINEAEFSDQRVGKKSLNLSLLRSKVPDWLEVPACVSLPFGSFERVLAFPENARAKKELEEVQSRLSVLYSIRKKASSIMEISDTLAEARRIVSQDLTAPPGLMVDVAAAALKAGLISSADDWTREGSSAWQAAWSAICQVWGSKWTERAWLSRRARDIADNELYMAVLLQSVIPAEYAFVLHTSNPITQSRDEMCGELVVGMGESLVGSHEGRALSFTCPTSSSAVKIEGFPSKRMALVAPASGTLIARSDANGEDLDDYAGAGLYDSIPVVPLTEQAVDYAANRLIYEDAFRAELLSRLVDVGSSIEAAFDGKSQDVEGVYSNGKLYVVQARPQVLASANA